MNELLSDGLWPRLRKLAKSAQRKHAAIAYVTDDRFIKFGQGDVLVTDASDGAIKAGQTSAHVLKRALGRGASLFSITGLHAKVYVFDRIAVIGSANLSSSSENLTEAALVTDQPSSVSMSRSLIEDLKEVGEVVDRGFINRISKLPVKKTPYRANGKRRRTGDKSSRTWLVGLKPIKERESEKPAIDEGVAEAEKNISNEESEVSWIRFRGNSRFRREARRGDTVIQIWTPKNAKKPSGVYHHAPIVLRQDFLDEDYTRFFVEEFPDADDIALSWGQFQRLFKQVGLSGKLSQWAHRELAPHSADALHNLWFDQ